MAFDDKVVAAMFVGLIIAGSLTAYLLVMNDVNGDPRTESHDYLFTGTIGGVECYGTGETTFVEHSGGLLLYTLTIKLDTATDLIFNFIFDENGCPDSFTNTESSVWVGKSDGYDCVLYMGDNCTILKMAIESSDYSLVGVLQGDES